MKSGIANNRFYIGDCLPVLAELVAKHGAFADLVYLDPPFNSDRLYNHTFTGQKKTISEQTAFKDTWRWTETAKAGFDEFVGNESPGSPAADFLRSMRLLLEKRDGATLAYLVYMTRRVSRIRAAMKPTASVYLHCDGTASHYLKLMMDTVFGRENFRNDIAWCYTGPGNVKRQYPRKHDNLLFYSASPSSVFNKDSIRVPYKDSIATGLGGDKGGTMWEGGHNKERMESLQSMGKVPEDWWEDIYPLTRMNKERTGYPTQKPVALLKRIISASSNPGDLVLDPFCGCGTTIEACHTLKRRVVGIDVARSAAQVITRRMWRHQITFGRLVVGDKTPSDTRGWGKVLPDEDSQDGVPEWARFQYAAIDAIPKAEQVEGAIQKTARLGADGGIDGRLYIKNPATGVLDSIVIQVKRKKQPGVEDVADTLLAVQNNNAFMGVLITLNPPTKGMLQRAHAESTRILDGKRYPKVAIMTYDEVKNKLYLEKLPHHLAFDLLVGG